MGQPVIVLREAMESDAALLWEWANEPGVRAASFHGDAIPWEGHVAWFGEKLADPSAHIYVAADERGDPVGVVRFQVDASGARAEISVALDARARGRGLGGPVIAAGVDRLFGLAGSTVSAIDAWIRPENEASARAFRRAGFEPAGTGAVGSAPALHMVRRR